MFSNPCETRTSQDIIVSFWFFFIVTDMSCRSLKCQWNLAIWCRFSVNTTSFGEFPFESTETGRLPSGCSCDARGGWRRFTGISHRLNADRFEVKFQGSWRLQTHFRNKWKSNNTFSKMFQIGVMKMGSWSEYIYFKHIFVLDMFSMEETLGCSFFKWQASALASALQRVWSLSGTMQASGGRIEHAGNQPWIIYIHVCTYEHLQTDYLRNLTNRLLRKTSIFWNNYQTYPKTVSLSWISAFGEVELLLLMLSNTPAALHY